MGGLEAPRRRPGVVPLGWAWAYVDLHWDCWVGAPYEPLELVEDSGLYQFGYLSKCIFANTQGHIFVSSVKTQVFYSVLNASYVNRMLVTGLDDIRTNISRQSHHPRGLHMSQRFFDPNPARPPYLPFG